MKYPKVLSRNKVIFVDWHGVMSIDRFWHSILNDPKHPLHNSLSEATHILFNENDIIVREWMRGEKTFSDIINFLNLKLGVKFDSNYLLERALDDCSSMSINNELVEILESIQAHANIILATDNMDCFYEAISSVFVDHTINSQLKNGLTVFDDILCSSNLGVLKSENPHMFFRGWLQENSLTFADAILIDDCHQNCNAFIESGGEVIRIDKNSYPDIGIKIINENIISWLRDVSK